MFQLNKIPNFLFLNIFSSSFFFNLEVDRFIKKIYRLAYQQFRQMVTYYRWTYFLPIYFLLLLPSVVQFV